MILTNVGLQIFNNWCSSRQNGLLQQKREDFEKAARERNTQRMWQLMREGQEITRQIEEEKHEQRLEELKNDIGGLLQRLAYSETISNWPLNVLPIVMKNQALGNLLANQEERIALHCVFTPSNSSDFNRLVFPRLDTALEEYINRYWGVMSEHPILFYSGAWKSNQTPTEVQIDSMRTALSNLPTLVVTPFFRPNDGKLVFHIRLWGVGLLNNEESEMSEIDPNEFQREYNLSDNFIDDTELMADLTEDIIPYLQCLIGYMADTYFWSYLGITPLLPLLLTNGTINTDGMKFLINEGRDYYDALFLKGEQNIKENPFMGNNLLTLYKGSAVLWDEKTRMNKLITAFMSYAYNRSGRSTSSMDEALMPGLYSKEDLPFIRASVNSFAGTVYESRLRHIVIILESVDFDYSMLESSDVEYLKFESANGNSIASYRLGEIYEYSIGANWDESLSVHYYNDAKKNGFLLALIGDNLELYDQSKDCLDCMSNFGVVQSILIKCKWLCSHGRKEEALFLLEKTYSTHPGILYQKAMLLLDVKGDAQQAEIILTSLADCGYVKAQEFLCKNYAEGNIFPANLKKHALYAEKAMLQNSPYATYAMALCYIYGTGVQESTSVGIMLIDKAEELGWQEAKRIKSLLNVI